MVVGGIAVNFLGDPRFTKDLDLVITIDPKKETNFIKVLRKNGFKFREDTLKILLKAGNMFEVYDPAEIYRIDFWIPKTDFENHAFSRKQTKKWENKKIHFTSPEDLILFKLLAGRPQDILDIKSILGRQKGKLDRKYLKFWAMYLNKYKELKELES